MILRLVADSLLERRFLKSVIDATDLFLSALSVRLFSHFTRVRRNKILFTNFSGTYDCNPKYICEEILRRKLPWEIVGVVWGARSGGKRNNTAPGQYPPELVLTDRYSGDFYRHLFGAKIIVDNGSSFVSANYPKKRRQFLLNTWHGSLGIKRFPKDDGGPGSRYNPVGRLIGRTTNLIVSNSEFEEMYYRETYFDRTPVKRLGHARNDLFFNRDPAFAARIQEKVRTALEIPPEIAPETVALVARAAEKHGLPPRSATTGTCAPTTCPTRRCARPWPTASAATGPSSHGSTSGRRSARRTSAEIVGTDSNAPCTSR